MPKGRPPSFDRSSALEQAMTVFWEHGYDASSITALTAAMGINPSSMYSAFGGKRQLFGEATDLYLQTCGSFTAAAIREEPTAYRAVKRLLTEAAIAYTGPGHPPGCLLITAATNCPPESADVKARLRALRTAGTEAIERKIAVDVLAGEMPADVDPHALAVFISATLQGMSGQARDRATRADLDQIAAIALRAWPGPRTASAETPADGE
jgi:AcrR family transcriptional regulator